MPDLKITGKNANAGEVDAELRKAGIPIRAVSCSENHTDPSKGIIIIHFPAGETRTLEELAQLVAPPLIKNFKGSELLKTESIQGEKQVFAALTDAQKIVELAKRQGLI